MTTKWEEHVEQARNMFEGMKRHMHHTFNLMDSVGVIAQIQGQSISPETKVVMIGSTLHKAPKQLIGSKNTFDTLVKTMKHYNKIQNIRQQIKDQKRRVAIEEDFLEQLYFKLDQLLEGEE